VEDTFTLTRSPYYNELIKSIKMVREDNFSGPSTEELLENLRYFSDFLKNFKNIYEEQKEIQVESPVIEEENKNIEENLKNLGEHIEKLRQGAKNKDIDILTKELSCGKKTVNSLFSSFDTIEKIWQEGPKYSTIPAVHEFLRIAQGVFDGKFNKKHLQKKADSLFALAKENYEDLLVLKKASIPFDIEEEVFKVEHSYKELLRGLNEMRDFFRTGEKSHLKTGMELVKEHSEQLVASQKILEKEKEEPAAKKCLRCGNNNPPEAKFCTKCRMVIPEFKAKSLESQMNIRLEEDRIVHGDGSVMTENFYRISQAVENFEIGKITEEQLAVMIDWIEKKVTSTRRQFETHKKKKPLKMPERDRKLTEEMEELTEKGISRFEEAVEIFKNSLEKGNYTLLRKGLECAKEAVENLYKAQTVFRDAVKQ